VRFLIDAQLPPKLVQWFDAKGHEAEHVFYLGNLASDDRLIWSAAIEANATIVTKDKDFVRYRRQSEGPQVLFIGLPNKSTAELCEHLEQNWQSLSLRLNAGQAIIQLR
jgi:predicted nuclease of predicted toxin-antitoxin system